MNAQLTLTLARERAAELRHAGEQAQLAREVRTSGRKLRRRNLITVESAPPPPPTPVPSALDITPRMFTLTGRRVGGRCQPSSGDQQQTTFEIRR